MIRRVTLTGSGNIHSFAYDSGVKRLEVVFLREGRAGDVYHYEGVPAEKVAQMFAAESVGSFFAREIRNAYPYQKVEVVHTEQELGKAALRALEILDAEVKRGEKLGFPMTEIRSAANGLRNALQLQGVRA